MTLADRIGQASGPDRIKAQIYDQDGNLQPFVMKDTVTNRLFAGWLARHDRPLNAAILRAHEQGGEGDV